MAPGRPEPAPRRGDVVELTLTDLAKGGAGIGHLPDGRVVFAQGGLPGDRVRVRLTRVKPRFASGDVVDRLAPSPQRVRPPCELAETCGGCPWMGLEYGAQLAAKGRIVAETLARLGGIDRALVLPPKASPRILGYRSRARLGGRPGALGFFGLSSHVIVDVPHCPVLDPALGRVLGEVRGHLAAHPPTGAYQVELALGEGGPAVAISGEGIPPVSLSGARVHHHPGPLDDPPRLHLPFAQANAQVNAQIVDHVLGHLEPGPGRAYLDLFCGSGNFALPLAAAGARVLGIEGREDAVVAAQAKSPDPHLTRFIAGDVAQVLAAEGPMGALDGAVINPPRGGAAEALGPLIDAAPRRLAYVSCDPATLARDLSTLAARYEIVEVQPFDMMPHTAHIEAVALLKARG